MKYQGSDLKYSYWIVIALLVIFPVVLFSPFLVPAIIGGALTWFGASQIRGYRNLPQWHEVKGTLVSTDIGVYEMSEGASGSPVSYFFPIAIYSYVYDGQVLSGASYAYDNKSIWSTNENEARNIILELEQQESIPVFLYPGNPRQSALNLSLSRNRWSHSFALLISGLVIGLVGGLLYVYSY